MGLSPLNWLCLVVAMLIPRKPEPVVCYCCRQNITGQAYQHGGLSYCAAHWLERQNFLAAKHRIHYCWELPAKERQP